MWGTIISAVLPLAIKLITMYLEKTQADIETKKAFLRFLKIMENKSNSTKLIDSIKKQRRRILEILNKKA